MELALAINTLLAGVPFIVAMLLGIALPFCFVACYRNFGFGLVLAALLFLLETLFGTIGGLQLGLTLYPTDIGYSLMAVVALSRRVFGTTYNTRSVAWNMYVLVFAISMGLGLISFGSGAGVQGRAFFGPIAACSYAMSFPLDRAMLERVLKWMIGLTVVLVLIAIYRWVVYYLPIPALLPATGSYNVDGAIRVIPADCVVLMAQVMVLAYFWFFGARFPAARIARVWLPLIACAVLVLQHRSVWVTAIAGLFIGFWCRKSGMAANGKQFLTAVALVCVIAIPISMSSSLSSVRGELSARATSALEGQGTAGERVNSWQQIIKKWYSGGPKSILIGESFGSDQSRFVFDAESGTYRKIDYAAHNFYVQTLSNFGIVGLSAYLAFLIGIMRSLYRRMRKDKDDSVALSLFVWLAMQMVYDIPYAAGALQHFILGCAFAYLRGLEPVRATRLRLSRFRAVERVS